MRLIYFNEPFCCYSSYYSKDQQINGNFDPWETWGHIYDALERQSNGEKYYIYRALCKHIGTNLENQHNKFNFKMVYKKKTIHCLMKSIGFFA